MNRLFRMYKRGLACGLISILCLCVKAELRTAFQLVHSVEELEADGDYLFFSADDEGKTYMLTHSLSKGKLLAQAVVLPSDTLLLSPDYTVWTLRQAGEQFLLYATASEEALCETTNVNNFALGTGKAIRWTFQQAADHRFICTNVREGKAYRLAFSPSTQTPVFGNYTASYYHNLIIYRKFVYSTDLPAAERDEHGLLTLRGNWTTDLLESLSFQGLTGIDLTELALPSPLPRFTKHEESPNTLLYIRASERRRIPATWRNVVICDKAENRLIRPLTLRDGFSFFFSRAFRVGNDSIRYERHVLPDGGWGTLYLPFSVSQTPREIVCETCLSVEADSIYLERATQLAANTPCLFYYTDKEVPSLLVFSGKAQLIQATEAEEARNVTGLTGIADTLFADTETPVKTYLLDDEGTAFVPAAAGSYLLPFRCWLCLPDENAWSALSKNRKKHIYPIH